PGDAPRGGGAPIAGGIPAGLRFWKGATSQCRSSRRGQTSDQENEGPAFEGVLIPAVSVLLHHNATGVGSTAPAMNTIPGSSLRTRLGQQPPAALSPTMSGDFHRCP